MNRAFMGALLALCLMLLAPLALASGNVTIAVQGQNDFDDYIESMAVWGDRLLLASWSRLYVWDSADNELIEVEGYDELNDLLVDGVAEDGSHTVTIGETVIELEEDSSVYFNGPLFVAGDRLFRQAYVHEPDGVTNTWLIEVCIAEDGAVSLGDVVDMGDQLTIDYGDGYTSMRDFYNVCYDDGLIYALSYGESGNELIALDIDHAIADVLNLDIGDAYVQSLSPYTQGKLMIVITDYTQDPVVTELNIYDIESEELSLVSELPKMGWDTPCGLVYDAENSRLIYALGGSVWRVPVSEDGLGEPEEFGDMPLEIYSDSSAVLMDGLYIISSYEGVIGRDVTVEKLPEQKLAVNNGAYVQAIRQAYYPFTDAHSEYMVSISSSSDEDSVLQDMMNRSGDVDIYVMNVESEAYTSLMARGYLAELSSSELLTQAVSSMYPSLQDTVMKDGELYAIPMYMYMSSFTFNTELFTEKLGYDEEDVPATWPEVFALLADLADSGKLEDFPEVNLMSPGMTLRDVQFSMFSQMMSDYFLWLDMDEANLMRGSEVLMANCAAFEAIDWEAFGLPEEYEDGMWEYDPDNLLFGSTSVTPQQYYDDESAPLVLSIEEGAPQTIGATVSVAFVNPISEHREEAIEYLEKAWELVDPSMRIIMMPEENEPVLNSYYEENLKWYDEYIADLQEQLEETEDEETRDMLNESLKDIQNYRDEYMETGRYSVSPASIERYRQYAEYCVVSRSTVWSSDTYSQISQYMDGAISAQQLASELEKTLQMKRLEGN